MRNEDFSATKFRRHRIQTGVGGLEYRSELLRIAYEGDAVASADTEKMATHLR
jgi:hypothetical protein